MLVAIYSHACESGKDTTATYMSDYAIRHVPGITMVQRKSFADEMKLVCADALDIKGTVRQKIDMIDRIKLTGGVCWDEGARPMTPTSARVVGGRSFIIGLAESIRRLDPSFWITHTLPHQQTINALDRLFLIPDLRFHEEAVMVKQMGGYIVEVARPGAPHVNEDRIHAQYIDAVIENTSTLRHLRMVAVNVLRRLIHVHHDLSALSDREML